MGRIPLSYSVRNVRVRWRTCVMAVLGVALVVTVLVATLAVAIGFRSALGKTGRRDNAIVTLKGSLSELTSFFPKENARVIALDPRVARDASGEPLASPEVVVTANLPRRDGDGLTSVTIRGVTPQAFVVRDGVRIVAGRRPTPGLNEVVVGTGIQRRVANLEVGTRLLLQRQPWEVVGAFTSDGSVFESEIWGDVDRMGPLFGRPEGYESLTVRLADPAQLAALAETISGDRRMQLQAAEERKYYDDQAGPLAVTLQVLAAFVAAVMAFGAVAGVMNTLYAVVAARTREIGTLRALGFPRGQVLAAFVLESSCLALAGGLLGCLLALPLNGLSTGTSQTASFSELIFHLRVTPGLLGLGLACAVTLGVLGGLLPAIRAARRPIAAALREA